MTVSSAARSERSMPIQQCMRSAASAEEGMKARQPLPGAGAGMGKRLSSATPHSPPESRAPSKRVPVPGQSRSWLPGCAATAAVNRPSPRTVRELGGSCLHL